MQIYIITRHSVPNYGSKLQTYALQKTVENLGHKAVIINYILENEENRDSIIWSFKNSKRTHNLLKAVFLALSDFASSKKRKKIFALFENRLNLTEIYNKKMLFQNPPEADIYMTGSDQVWNNDLSDENLGFDSAYFLEFVKNKKRIAYAASFGRLDFNAEELNFIGKYCDKYKAISVRESFGVKILEKAGIKNSIHVLDPTFLLTKSEWLSIAQEINIKGKYILVYSLYGGYKNVFSYAFELSRKTNLPIIHFSTSLHNCIVKNCKFIFCPSVEEFISLFNNAEYVVTNSFHGTAFSINLNKQFFTVYPKLNTSRLSSILELTNLKKRNATEFADMDAALSNPIDYNIVNEILKIEREKSIAFLRSAVNDN